MGFYAQRVTWDIPTGLRGADGFHAIWPRLTAHQAIRMLKAHDLLSDAGDDALPGAIDQDYLDISGASMGTLLADGALHVIEAGNWSGSWNDETGGDSKSRTIWYSDWLPATTTAIETREAMQTAWGTTEASARAALQAALTDSEIQNLLWDTPQSSAGGSYSPTIPWVRTRFEVNQYAKPNAGTVTNQPTPATDLANGTTGSEDEVSSASHDFAASSGTVSSTADAGGGSTTVTTAAAHGFVDSEKVTIAGTTDYNGEHTVSNASGTTFDIAVAFTSDQSGTYTYTGDEGKVVIISGGAGWTVATYKISSVAGGVATLDSAPAIADSTDGEWVMQHFDYLTEGFVMCAEDNQGQGTSVSWVGSGDSSTTPSGSGWADRLSTDSLLRLHDGSGEFVCNLVYLNTPGKTVRSYFDGEINDPGQQNAGLWMDEWRTRIVEGDAATTDDYDDPGSPPKKFFADLKTAGGSPDYIFWDIRHSPTANHLFVGFGPQQSENGELFAGRSGALVGGLGQTKQIASIAQSGSDVIVTLDNNRISHLDPDVGTTQAEHTFTFENVTGTTALNGTHVIAYDSGNAFDSQTILVPNITFVATGTGQCYATFGAMQDSRWPMLNGYNLETIFGDELDSFDIARGTAGSWQEHTDTPSNGVIANWRGDERTAVFSGIWQDYEIGQLGQLWEYVAGEFTSMLPLTFHYHQQAPSIFPSANCFWVEVGQFSMLPKVDGHRPMVACLGTTANNYWDRKNKQIRPITYTGTDSDDWNYLLYVSSQIKSAAACSNVPNLWWFGMERDYPNEFNVAKYFQWFMRMGWLTGWQPVMHTELLALDGQLLRQSDIDDMRVGTDNAETRIGGSDFQGWVLDDPHHEDLFDQKYIRLCRDVAGKFLNIVLIRPDEYDGGNFVVNGDDIDVKDAAGTTTFLTIPNASVTEETDNGAWITQTQL